jgi:hypothetical protein
MPNQETMSALDVDYAPESRNTAKEILGVTRKKCERKRGLKTQRRSTDNASSGHVTRESTKDSQT